MSAINYNTLSFGLPGKGAYIKGTYPLNRKLIFGLILVVAVSASLAFVNLITNKDVMETRKEVTKLLTVTTDLESSIYQILSPELLEEKASTFNLIGVKAASYVVAPTTQTAARR